MVVLRYLNVGNDDDDDHDSGAENVEAMIMTGFKEPKQQEILNFPYSMKFYDMFLHKQLTIYLISHTK